MNSMSRLVSLGLVGLYLVGLYTFIPLYLAPSVPVPAFMAGVAGWILVARNARAAQARHVLPLAGFLAVAALTVLFAPEAGRLLAERLKGLVYLGYSLAIGYGVFLEMERWSVPRMRRVWAVAAGLVIAGAALELFTPVGALSDAVREAVFREGLYVGDLRDETIAGMERPKFFTSEPSFVAIFVLGSTLNWLILGSGGRRYGIFLLVNAFAMVVIRSPILLLALPSALFVALSESPPRPGRWVRTPWRVRRGTLMLLSVGGVAFLVVSVSLATVFQARLGRVVGGQDHSVLMRVAIPPLIAARTVMRSPAWGAGVSGVEAIEGDILAVYAIQGINTDHMDDVLDNTVNMFWLHWINLGLVGGLLVAGCLVVLSWRIVPPRGRLPFWLIVGVLSQTMGGYVGARFWSYFFLIGGSMAAAGVARSVAPAGEKVVHAS